MHGWGWRWQAVDAAALACSMPSWVAGAGATLCIAARAVLQLGKAKKAGRDFLESLKAEGEVMEDLPVAAGGCSTDWSGAVLSCRWASAMQLGRALWSALAASKRCPKARCRAPLCTAPFGCSSWRVAVLRVFLRVFCNKTGPNDAVSRSSSRGSEQWHCLACASAELAPHVPVQLPARPLRRLCPPSRSTSRWRRSCRWC
jgi:hypothetical protein